MSAHLKKKKNGVIESINENSDSSGESSSDESEIAEGEIEVEFDARSPVDADFNGIKQLLHQLFLKEHLHLGALSDLLIQQGYVGCAIKQYTDEEESGEDEDADNQVFGITSVLNLTHKKDVECIATLRSLLVEKCEEHGDDRSNRLLRQILSDEGKATGFLLNERFVNIPPQIAVPSLEALKKDMEKAVKKEMPFNFSYYIMMCKLHKQHNQKTKKKSKHKEEEPQIVWSNPEEEIFEEHCLAQFEYSVAEQTDSGGGWKSSEQQLQPYRRVLIFPADRLDEIIEAISTALTQPP